MKFFFLSLAALLVACTRSGETSLPPADSQKEQHPCCTIRQESSVCDPTDPLFEFRYVTREMSPPPLPGQQQPYPVCVVPDEAIPFGHGMLLVTDGGEFGGQLAYRAPSGSTTVLLNENPQAVHRLDQVYAFTGLHHMSMNRGSIYRIDRSTDGMPRAVLVATLDGAPLAIRKSGSGIAFNTSIFQRRGDDGRAQFETKCYAFSAPAQVKAVACDSHAAPNNSLKGMPLRGTR